MATQAKTPEKPKRKKVSSNYATPWEKLFENEKVPVGATLEGIYTGFDLVPGERNEKFRSHRVKVEGREDPVGVSGAMIDTKMVRIPVGSYVWISRLPDEKLKNGMAKNYEVEVAEGVELLDVSNNPDQDFE